MQPDDPDTKTGMRVVDVLSDKHPAMRIPDLERTDWASFKAYDTSADLIPLDCTESTVSDMIGTLQVGAGPSRVDANSLVNWMQRYSRATKLLPEELAA